MAEADIAYVATAGAAGLAIAASAWAWRLRARLAMREQALDDTLAGLMARSALSEGALRAFEDVRIALTPEGGFDRAFIGEGILPLLEPGQSEDQAVQALVEAIRRNNNIQLQNLVSKGEAFDSYIPTAEGDWAIEGRALGGTLWLRLARLTNTEGGSDVGLGALADVSPSPTWVTNGRGQLIWANRAWLSETRSATLAKAREGGVSFDRGADNLVAEASRLNQRQEGFRWLASEGGRKAWRIVAEPLAGGRGAVIAFALDMTEAEETRDNLRRHVEAHDETLNHLADAVAIFGPQKRLAFHNTAFQTLFHLDPAWLDERPTHAELLDRLRQRRQLPEVVDYAGWKAKELEFYGASVASPDDSWSLPDGRTLRVVRQPHPLGGILLIFSDITGELELRSRYNAQIQVQRATLDKLNDAVAVFGSDSRLRLHNEAFEALWRLSGQRLTEASSFDVIAQLCQSILPDQSVWLGLKARVTDPDPESRVPISGEARTLDGRVLSWQTRPLPDGATLVGFSDISARRDLEQALAAKEAALMENQALKREFVGSVSYELRTPLTTIVGYSELLEAMGELPDRSRQHAGAIRVAASQLARSIDDVLDMAQIDAGEMELALGDVWIDDLLQTSAERIRSRIEGRGASLRVHWDKTLKPLRADGRRVAQALDHLLEHAARAVSEGGRVSLSAEAGVDEIRIRVEDTGRGIPYHLQAHVFDRFVRRERGGPGVALALVKALVELHGGWAEVQSEPGKGAAFILHLPHQPSIRAASPELGLA